MKRLLWLAPFLLAACSPDSGVVEPAPAGNEAAPPVQTAADFNEEAATKPADDATLRELNSLFVQLGHAGRNNDSVEGVKLFDMNAMLSVLQAASGLKFNVMEQRNAFITEMKSGAGQWFTSPISPFRWQRATIRKASLSESGNMAIVFMRLELDDEGSIGKWRFWLTRTAEGWRVFDWENLNLGIRTTRQVAALLPNDMPGSDRWIFGISFLNRGWALVEQGDYDRAFHSLSAAGRNRLPSELEATRRALLGVCLVNQGQPERALEDIDAALALRPDFADARFTRGLANLGLERYEDALKDFRAYLEMLGSDPVGWVQVGHCLTWLNRHEDALKAYISGVEDLPTPDGIIGLAVCLPPDKAADVGPYFRRLRNQARHYSYIIGHLLDNEGLIEPARVINAEYRKINPKDIDLAWYDAAIAISESRFGDAAALLKEAMIDISSQHLERFRETYRWCMVKAGKALELLEDEKRSAWMFNYLAQMMFDEQNIDELNQLCEAWREGNDGRSVLHYWLGYAAYHDQKFSEAQPHFEKARKLANLPKEQDESLLSGLVRSMAHQGEWLKAYREVKPVSQAFLHLADWAFHAADAAALEKLIDLRTRDTSSDLYLPRARGDLAWLKKDYKAAAIDLSLYIAREGKKYDLPWHVNSRCVRALLRSGQPAVAESQARNWWLGGRTVEDDYMLAVVYAVTDQPAKAIERINAFAGTDQYGTVLRLYDDEDAGAKFRGEAYARLHKDFPPPPEKPAAD